METTPDRTFSKWIADSTWGWKQLEPNIRIIAAKVRENTFLSRIETPTPEDLMTASGEPHAHAMGRAFVVWSWWYGRKWREACSLAACDIQTGAACFRCRGGSTIDIQYIFSCTHCTYIHTYIQYNTIQYNTIQYISLPYLTLHCITLDYITLHTHVYTYTCIYIWYLSYIDMHIAYVCICTGACMYVWYDVYMFLAKRKVAEVAVHSPVCSRCCRNKHCRFLRESAGI